MKKSLKTAWVDVGQEQMILMLFAMYYYDSLLCLLWVAVSGKPSLSVLSSVSMVLCRGCELAKLSVIGSGLSFLLATRVCLPEHKPKYHGLNVL